jgi:hypothetical protein
MASLAVNPKSPSSQKADHFVSKRVRDAFFRKFCMQSGKYLQFLLIAISCFIIFFIFFIAVEKKLTSVPTPTSFLFFVFCLCFSYLS